MRAAVIADDTTGALEAGALLADAAVPCKVLLEGVESRAEAVVLTTESRHVTPAEASERVGRMARRLREAGAEWFYKKTDSTLRGNIAAEFEALLDSFPETPLVYVPAHPAVGRTVVNGVLLVDGRPVAETEFQNDPHNPVRESSVLRLLEGRYPVVSCARPAQWMGDGARIIVCDAGSQEDLAGIAGELKASGRRFLAAGPAGFIRYWAPMTGLGGAARRRVPAATRCLFVHGSLHPVSRRMRVEDTSIATPDEVDPDSAAVMPRLTKAVREHMETGDYDALVVFGGDTAAAVLRDLEVRQVQPAGEVLPGIPASLAKFRSWPFTLVTKAGGFGDDGTAARISEWLKGNR